MVEVLSVRTAVGALLREGALDAVTADGAGPVHRLGISLSFGGRLLAAYSAHFVGQTELLSRRIDVPIMLLAPLARDRNLDLDRDLFEELRAGPFHGGFRLFGDLLGQILAALDDELVVDTVY